MLFLEIGNYLKVVGQLEQQMTTLRREITTIPLELRIGKRDVFPRTRLSETHNGRAQKMPAAFNIHRLATHIKDTLIAVDDTLEVAVEIGYVMPRVNTQLAHAELAVTDTFIEKVGKPFPAQCRRWNVDHADATIALCYDTPKPDALGLSSHHLWSLFKDYLRKGPALAADQKSFPGTITMARKSRRNTRYGGSSLWLMFPERRGSPGLRYGGNDYVYLEHPRFGVLMGYAITIKYQQGFLATLLKTSETESLTFSGLLPSGQDI